MKRAVGLSYSLTLAPNGSAPPDTRRHGGPASRPCDDLPVNARDHPACVGSAGIPKGYLQVCARRICLSEGTFVRRNTTFREAAGGVTAGPAAGLGSCGQAFRRSPAMVRGA